MDIQRYEHHIAMRQDRLCPFKITASDMWESGCNWHNNIELLLVTQGRGYLQRGSEEFAMGPHDLAVINSGELHRVYSEQGVTLHYMIIDEKFCAENGIEAEAFCFEKCFQDPETEAMFLTAVACDRAYREAPTPLQAAKLRQAVLSLLIRVCENHTCPMPSAGKEQRPSEAYIKKAVEYLSDRYTEAVSLEAVAKICGITKYHLAREFKRYTGQTVFTYLNFLRCRHAQLCFSRGMTVTQAALESGFESVSYFSRTYKRLMGSAPSGRKRE